MVDGSKLASEIKYYSSYSKYITEEGKKEHWEDSVHRVMDMHKEKFKKVIDKKPELLDYINEATEAYIDKLVLGSQRALQFGGEPMLKHEARNYNCLTSYCDRVEFFQECMYWLLCGCGTGFSVQNKHIKRLPKLCHRSKEAKVFVVPDSIEGWSDAFGVLISSYVKEDATFPEYQGHQVHFDLSKIRPKGAMISGGFKAPGPDGLRQALTKIEDLLNNYIGKKSDVKFKSIIAYDVVMFMSDAVLSGGLRRSATICLFSPNDKDMLNAKTGNWFVENPQRGRSNNSVILVRKKTTREQFLDIIESVKSFGEPGFVFVEDEDILVNPCVEIGMWPQTEGGVSGWQGCNLTEMNGGAIVDVATFIKACRASAILGTLQAGYTNFKYINKVSKEIFEKEALLGCSITGWMNSPDILFDEDVLKQGAEVIKQVNREVADIIGINYAARTTCVKPSGNASVLLRTASGIHGEHAPKYFRNMQINKEEDIGKYFAKINPSATEESVWSAGGTDWMFSFPVEVKEGSICKENLYGVKQLDYVKKVQQSWVEEGTNVELCSKPFIRHNVSNTISVDDWNEVANYIYDNKDYFAGISLLSKSGDRDYAQAPFQEVYEAEDLLVMYGDAAMFASGLVVDALHAFPKGLWNACDTALGMGEDISEETSSNLLMRDWVRRCIKFANNYFDMDAKVATYCLKDVYNLHRWNKIQQSLKEIDWDNFDFQPSYTEVDTTGSIACQGGVCEIVNL